MNFTLLGEIQSFLLIAAISAGFLYCCLLYTSIKENMMVDIAMLAQLKPAAINQQLVVLLYMKHTPGFNPVSYTHL